MMDHTKNVISTAVSTQLKSDWKDDILRNKSINIFLQQLEDRVLYNEWDLKEFKTFISEAPSKYSLNTSVIHHLIQYFCMHPATSFHLKLYNKPPIDVLITKLDIQFKFAQPQPNHSFDHILTRSLLGSETSMPITEIALLKKMLNVIETQYPNVPLKTYTHKKVLHSTVPKDSRRSSQRIKNKRENTKSLIPETSNNEKQQPSKERLLSFLNTAANLILDKLETSDKKEVTTLSQLKPLSYFTYSTNICESRNLNGMIDINFLSFAENLMRDIVELPCIKQKSISMENNNDSIDTNLSFLIKKIINYTGICRIIKPNVAVRKNPDEIKETIHQSICHAIASNSNELKKINFVYKPKVPQFQEYYCFNRKLDSENVDLLLKTNIENEVETIRVLNSSNPIINILPIASHFLSFAEKEPPIDKVLSPNILSNIIQDSERLHLLPEQFHAQVDEIVDKLQHFNSEDVISKLNVVFKQLIYPDLEDSENKPHSDILVYQIHEKAYDHTKNVFIIDGKLHLKLHKGLVSLQECGSLNYKEQLLNIKKYLRLEHNQWIYKRCRLIERKFNNERRKLFQENGTAYFRINQKYYYVDTTMDIRFQCLYFLKEISYENNFSLFFTPCETNNSTGKSNLKKSGKLINSKFNLINSDTAYSFTNSNSLTKAFLGFKIIRKRLDSSSLNELEIKELMHSPSDDKHQNYIIFNGKLHLKLLRNAYVSLKNSNLDLNLQNRQLREIVGCNYDYLMKSLDSLVSHSVPSTPSILVNPDEGNIRIAGSFNPIDTILSKKRLIQRKIKFSCPEFLKIRQKPPIELSDFLDKIREENQRLCIPSVEVFKMIEKHRLLENQNFKIVFSEIISEDCNPYEFIDDCLKTNCSVFKVVDETQTFSYMQELKNESVEKLPVKEPKEPPVSKEKKSALHDTFIKKCISQPIQTVKITTNITDNKNQVNVIKSSIMSHNPTKISILNEPDVQNSYRQQSPQIQGQKHVSIDSIRRKTDNNSSVQVYLKSDYAQVIKPKTTNVRPPFINVQHNRPTVQKITRFPVTSTPINPQGIISPQQIRLKVPSTQASIMTNVHLLNHQNDTQINQNQTNRKRTMSGRLKNDTD